jgi:plastocyanin
MGVKDRQFSPPSFSIVRGDIISITNYDPEPHNFSIEGTSVNIQIDPGMRGDTGVLDLTPGTYRFVCTIHTGMWGSITVSSA